jgi:signal transduction histidine kinase
VVRVLAFVDEMMATSELVEEPSVTLDLIDVVREALTWVEGSDRISVIPPVRSMRATVTRTRLVRALSNLVANALQATTQSQPVRISLRSSSTWIEIAVEDGGPGVPAASRERVFDDGFTTRPGGSGFGLAFVRSVVEARLRGKVSCDESELGGARFVIALPVGVET